MARTTQDNGLKRPLYATVGAADKAVEVVRESITDLQARLAELQQSINELEREPRQLRARAARAVSTQTDAVRASYDDLVDRGDALVRRVRRQKSTQDTLEATRVASSKAKSTRTQAGHAAQSTASATKRAAGKATSTARRESRAPQSSAKATATGARKAAKSAARATADATSKVGD